MLWVNWKHVSLNLARVPRYIHQHLPGHDPQAYRPRSRGARRLHFLDGVDDAADDLFGVRGAEGAIGAVDGGLDDRICIFDRFDEGAVRRGVALDDTKVRVVAHLGRELCRVAEEGRDMVLLAQACREGSRAYPT